MKLYMVLAGCRPVGRNTEQHDVFFGVAGSLKDLLPELFAFWPEAKKRIHIDAWREITQVGDYAINVIPRSGVGSAEGEEKLFFINLGGYKPGEFEEFHYKMVAVGADKGEAVRQSKQTAFYKHTGFKGATSHVDDKFGVDVDDIYQIDEIMSAEQKAAYAIQVKRSPGRPEDPMHLGYLKIEKVLDEY